MFGGCGAPVVPGAAAALSTSSSRHLVIAAADAMATAPGAAEPGLAPRLGLRRVGPFRPGGGAGRGGAGSQTGAGPRRPRDWRRGRVMRGRASQDGGVRGGDRQGGAYGRWPRPAPEPGGRPRGPGERAADPRRPRPPSALLPPRRAPERRAPGPPRAEGARFCRGRGPALGAPGLDPRSPACAAPGRPRAPWGPAPQSGRPPVSIPLPRALAPSRRPLSAQHPRCCFRNRACPVPAQNLSGGSPLP